MPHLPLGSECSFARTSAHCNERYCNERSSLLGRAPMKADAKQKYSNAFFSYDTSYVIDKVSAAFQRFFALLSDFATTIHMRMTTTQMLPPTAVDDRSFTEQGTRTIEASIEASIAKGKDQLHIDVVRPGGTNGNTFHFLVNGKRVTPQNALPMIAKIKGSTGNKIKQLRIFNMFQQAFFATSTISYSAHVTPNNPTDLDREQAMQKSNIARGAAVTPTVNGVKYEFRIKTTHIRICLDTKTQTITGHQLLTPATSDSDLIDKSNKTATNLPGFPNRPYYIRSTYHYGHPHTIEMKQMDPKYFPSSS